jgi:hypothetical protein
VKISWKIQAKRGPCALQALFSKLLFYLNQPYTAGVSVPSMALIKLAISFSAKPLHAHSFLAPGSCNGAGGMRLTVVFTPQAINFAPYCSASSRSGSSSAERIRAGGKFFSRLDCSGDA